LIIAGISLVACGLMFMWGKSDVITDHIDKLPNDNSSAEETSKDNGSKDDKAKKDFSPNAAVYEIEIVPKYHPSDSGNYGKK